MDTDIVRIITIFLAIFLGSCALLPGSEDYENTDSGPTTVRLANANGTSTDWSVSHRPEVNKVLVSLPAGRAMGLSIAGSMVLSPSAFLPQPEDYQKAAIQFLSQSERSGCNIVTGSKTSQFQYEFNYDCANASNSFIAQPRTNR